MKRMLLFLVLFLPVFLGGPNLRAEDPFKKMDEQWDSFQKETEKKWDALQKEQEDKWQRFKVEVEQKWQDFVHSTKKDWVEYNMDKDVRSHVDFENGTITFEALIAEDDSRGLEKARRKIEKQAEGVLLKQDIANKKVLENQVINKQGDKVEPKNLKQYIQKEVLPKVTPAPQPYRSRDGVERRRYSLSLNMVPNHVRIRAEKYLPVVKKNAKRFNIKPQLVLAVMHTESYFNPEAVSVCDAVGIMQIIPKYAGREAYSAIYGGDRIPSWEYLKIPENNIELGCKYLALLRYNHFKDVQGDVKNRYVSICGYNWGPTSMRKKIVNRYPISQMSDSRVYTLLRQKTPEETRNYIKRVTERMPIYDPFF